MSTESSAENPAQTPALRLDQIKEIARSGGAQTIENLIPFLIDEDEAVRQGAEAALNKVYAHWDKTAAARAAVPMLEAALYHDNYWIGLSASAVLQRITGEQAVAPREADTTTVSTVRENAATEILISLLKEPDADLRLAATEGLGQISNATSTAALAERLEDSDEWVRWHAARFLEKRSWRPSDESQKSQFLVALRRWDEAVRIGPAAVSSLLDALESSNAVVRAAAAQSLGALKLLRAEPALVTCLKDSSKNVRRAAASALAGLDAKTLSAEIQKALAEELRN